MERAARGGRTDPAGMETPTLGEEGAGDAMAAASASTAVPESPHFGGPWGPPGMLPSPTHLWGPPHHGATHPLRFQPSPKDKGEEFLGSAWIQEKAEAHPRPRVI